MNLKGKVKKLARHLERWHAKLKDWLALSMLVLWHVKMRSWHAFYMFARGYVDHVGTHGILGTQFSKLDSNHKVKYWASDNILKDLVRICSLHIISRNDSNSFLLINLQKTKTCPKIRYCSKGYLFWYRHVTLDGFLSTTLCHFNDVQINSRLHLSSSLWGITLRCSLFRKRIDQENVFL